MSFDKKRKYSNNLLQLFEILFRKINISRESEQPKLLNSFQDWFLPLNNSFNHLTVSLNLNFWFDYSFFSCFALTLSFFFFHNVILNVRQEKRLNGLLNIFSMSILFLFPSSIPGFVLLSVHFFLFFSFSLLLSLSAHSLVVLGHLHRQSSFFLLSFSIF